jgi:hypothetical protein
VTPETRELLRRIWRPVPATGGAAKKTKTVRPKSHAKGSTCIST